MRIEDYYSKKCSIIVLFFTLMMLSSFIHSLRHSSVGVPLQEGDSDVAWPCNPKDTYVCHFPQEPSVWRYGPWHDPQVLKYLCANIHHDMLHSIYETACIHAYTPMIRSRINMPYFHKFVNLISFLYSANPQKSFVFVIRATIHDVSLSLD